MKLSIETFFSHKNAPLYQAGALLVVILIGNILKYLVEASGLKTFDELFPWVISGSILLAFTLLNTLIGLNTETKMNVYYGKSLIGFLGLALGASVLAKTQKYTSWPIRRIQKVSSRSSDDCKDNSMILDTTEASSHRQGLRLTRKYFSS